MLEINEIFSAFQFAVVAYVFVCVLQKQGYIFEAYGDFLDDLDRRNKRWKWVTKPLGNCEICFAGQIGLWFYDASWPHDIFSHICFISFCILFTQIIKISFEKIKK